MRGIPNVIVYIDDLLIHSWNHEEHLGYLEQVLKRLSQEIKPGKEKLRAIKAAQPPTDMKALRSFIGLCNFFRTHIKNFATVSAPLTKLTRKDSGYNGCPLPKEALDAFLELKKEAHYRTSCGLPNKPQEIHLITDALKGTNKIAGGFGAILTQIDEKKNYHVIAYGSRQLRDHKLNYSSYLAEMVAANWGMEYFKNYLRGKPFSSSLITNHWKY